MSRRAKPTGKAKAGRDPHDRDLRKLALFLEEDTGFRLGLVTYDTPATRRTYLDRLAEAVAARPVHLTTLDLTSTPKETQLLRRLQEHLRDHPAPEGERPAVMVVGLEATIDYGALGPELFGQPRPGRVEALASIFNANAQRDAFPRLVPAAVVLWLSPTAATIFVQAAPDLWHWRSATFQFTGPPGGRLQLERDLVATPPLESDNLPTARKHERLAMLRDLLIEMEHATDRETPGARARRAGLELQIGMQWESLSKPDSAIEHLTRALDLYRAIGDRQGEGNALNNLGNAYSDLDSGEAIGRYRQALEVFRAIGNRHGEGKALNNLGLVYAGLDRGEEAIDHYQRALEVFRAVGDRWGERAALSNLGNAYAGLGRDEEAIGYLQRALEIAREIGDRRVERVALNGLGSAYAGLGRDEEAIGYLQRALEIAREIDDRYGEGVALGHLGHSCYRLGRYGEAIDLLERALQIGQQIESRWIIRYAEWLLLLVRRYGAEGAGGSGQAGGAG